MIYIQTSKQLSLSYLSLQPLSRGRCRCLCSALSDVREYQTNIFSVTRNCTLCPQKLIPRSYREASPKWTTNHTSLEAPPERTTLRSREFSPFSHAEAPRVYVVPLDEQNGTYSSQHQGLECSRRRRIERCKYNHSSFVGILDLREEANVALTYFPHPTW